MTMNLFFSVSDANRRILDIVPAACNQYSAAHILINGATRRLYTGLSEYVFMSKKSTQMMYVGLMDIFNEYQFE